MNGAANWSTTIATTPEVARTPPRTRTQHVDFDLVFYEDIPADWITGATLLDESLLLESYRR